ncbi:histidinol-phosphate transaminase [Pseudidiomarina insulisalsae]|uniref:Histidinol-phosphate aminotransferase n=1 Tax=Pseudidiomarina insulisalsae TaxID=575789 RepID=A0A432YEZ3_9GAMM|nr:histidinol-phosphate transaminase [Pseudidiomarina insulisalsae]RUO59522.1 histidinol-phosphate transaminase [Pseudidiomarina insulisalsae]
MSKSVDFIAALQRPHLANIIPYQSARRSMSGGSTWLNANEAPQSPAFPEQGNWHRYPSFQSDALNQAYADYAGVDLAQVLSCRGSDEAIELLIRSFCEPQRDAVMITTPTYGMYAISAVTHGADVVDCPLQPDSDGTLQLDVATMVERVNTDTASRVKLIFICSPSNPLGNEVNTARLQSLLEQVGERALVVLDQAYIEFIAGDSAQRDITSWLAQYPQLVVLRTLSKAFGLAALRCGFALAQAEVIEILRKVIAPYPLPEPTVRGATRALSAEGITLMQQQLAMVLDQRDRLLAELSRRDWAQKVWPTVTNFVLISVEDADALVRQCQQAGVLIRNQSSQRGLGQCVRISIGSAEEIDRLLEVLPA